MAVHLVANGLKSALISHSEQCNKFKTCLIPIPPQVVLDAMIIDLSIYANLREDSTKCR